MTIFVNQRDGGRCESTPVVTSKQKVTEAVLETTARQTASGVVRVRLEQLATGCWSVEAAAGNRGGLFRDYASAKKFIRREFAARQLTVVEMLSA